MHAIGTANLITEIAPYLVFSELLVLSALNRQWFSSTKLS